MNRLIPVLLAISLTLAACAPSLQQPSGNQAETAQAFANTAAALTVAAQPTQTPFPTQTPNPTATFTATVLPSNTPAPTTIDTASTASMLVGTITVTTTFTVTGTLPSPTNTVTGTPPKPTNTVTGTPPSATPTEDLVKRVYGTQPPYIHYGRVHLVNQANRDVYVSFQCTTPEGYFSIVEYPVFGRITVSVPAGRCEWVAWVGGRQFSGKVGISRFEELTMTFKKNSVTIK